MRTYRQTRRFSLATALLLLLPSGAVPAQNAHAYTGGYARTVSGDTLTYASPISTSRSALISRATDGRSSIAWETETAPLPAAAQPVLRLVDPLEPVFPDSNDVRRWGQHSEADFPSGTPADVLVLLTVSPGESFSVSAVLSGIQLPPGCWSRLLDVPVEQNTGLEGRTEAFTNQRNPYVIRRAPFRIYEALQPLQAATVTAGNTYTALRLAVPPEMLAAPGTYRVEITAKGTNWRRQGTFVATVHRARLPRLAESTFIYTNWFSLPQMEEKHGLARWSTEWLAMLDLYAAMMAHGRQNCIMVPAEVISLSDGRISLDEEHLRAFVDVFRRHGFQYFESPHLMYRGDEDDWGDPELKVCLTKRRYGTPEAKKDVERIVTLTKSFTAGYGLTGKWLQHISDEPTAVQARCYREVVNQVRSISPDIRIIEATGDRDTLAGAVDVWCPTIDDFQKNESFFRSRQLRNEKVLVYTCLVPGGKWLNRLLDQERLRQVYFGWGAAHFGTSGYLHWALNQYQTKDPFNQSVVHHPSPAAAPNNFLPAGDTHILYPGAAGPLSSTRFEAMRIGIEDFELLQVLKKKDGPGAEELMRQVFRDYTDYSTDVTAYRAARRRLLHEL